MRRARKNGPGAQPIHPFVRRFYEPSRSAGVVARPSNLLAWAAFVTPLSCIDNAYWILVAPCQATWSCGPAAVVQGLLAVVKAMTQELDHALQALDTEPQSVDHAEPGWIWVLRDPRDVFHLVNVKPNRQIVKWSPMPALDPIIASGSRQALHWLFPNESPFGLLAIDAQPWDTTLTTLPVPHPLKAPAKFLPPFTPPISGS